MALGWREIEQELGRHRSMIRKWVKRYHLVLLRRLNRQPYLTREIFEQWMVKMEEIRKRKKTA